MLSQPLAINEIAKVGCGNEAVWEALLRMTAHSS